jgi:hypothetical protein
MIAGKLDAVLPLTIEDLERFQVMSRSLKANFRDLNILWIVTKDREYEELASRIKEENYCVLPESRLIPELKYYKNIMTLITSLKFRKTRPIGWFVQQLVKMAIAPTIETDFYLTLDADVLCLRTVRYQDLIVNGRAITNTTDQDWHADWYRWSERVLDLERSGITHGVTPAIFSKKAMIKLHGYLYQKSNRVLKAVARLVPYGSLPENLLRGWRSYLLRNMPWTEYALYHIYLEATNLFDEYHLQAGENAIYDTRNSAWYEDTACDWDPGKLHENSFFMIVQSRVGLNPEYILKRITHLVPE